MPLKIVRNDIVKMNTEAIVNTANHKLVVGTGCDYAVYMAAGYDELLSYREEHIGEVQEGEVFITPGFKLQAKYIIHAVSPRYKSGSSEEEDKLRGCYRKSLLLAKENGIRSIAFPLISTGTFGYPRVEGIRIALDEIYSFLVDNDMTVYIVVFDEKSVELGEKIYPELEAYIDHNYVAVKNDEEYDRGMSSDTRMFLSKSCLEKNNKKPQKRKEFVEVSSEGLEMTCNEAYDFDDEEAFNELKRKLDNRKANLALSFSEYLLYLIKEHGMTNVEVYKRAIVDKKLFAKIKNDPTYHPQKITCLCLCVGAKLNLDETKDLLSRAGYALSPSDMRDVIFSYFIENEIYDMVELDIQLEEYGIQCIIA